MTVRTLAARAATTGLIVVHNHPTGDHAPSPEDVALTRRLPSAGAILNLPLLDHPIVGENARYYRSREAGTISALVPCTHHQPVRTPPAITTRDRTAPLGPVKPRRSAPTPLGLAGLTGAYAAPVLALT
jgi:hypothetical protein